MNKKTIFLGIAAFSASLLLDVVTHPFLAYPIKTTPLLSQVELYLAQATSTYRIGLGDNLSGIAHKYNITLGDILRANPDLQDNPNLIAVGQTINITARKTTKQPTTPKKNQNPHPRLQAFDNLNLPRERRMGANRIAAKRGPGATCTKNPNEQLKALLPEGNFGYTLLEYPVFLWYMPELTSQDIPIKFRIRLVGKEPFDEPIYNTSFQSKGIGVMSFSLPPEAPPLKEGQEYEWEVRIECTQDTSIFTRARIQRLSTNNPELNSQLKELSSQLEKASIEDYPAIYAKVGFWYDALSTLAALRQQQPTNNDLTNDWGKILEKIGFRDIANAPLLTTKTQ